jgi:transposase-like protein
MAKGKPIPDNVRAQIIAALLQGQGVTETANQYKVDKATVSRLKRTIPADRLQQVATEKRADFENLIAEYVAEGLAALTAQLRVIGRPEYIQKQDAASLATLHGVVNDKIVRLLAAFQPADDANGDA